MALAPTPSSAPAHPEHFVQVPSRVWKLLLGLGAVVWVIAAVITEITEDEILVPTVIIVGSFMVPVTVAAFALSRKREGYLTTEEVLLGFLGAGTLGLVATAVAEVYLLPAAAGTFIAVGVIEEVGKGAVLLAVAHHGTTGSRATGWFSARWSGPASRRSRARATRCRR